MAERVDLAGKVALVTGATVGVGLEVARGLAMRRARVVLVSRTRERGAAVVEELQADTCNDRVELELVDLARGADIQELAARVGARHGRLDVLVHGATAWRARRELTDAGVERTFATTALGMFTLTRALTPMLRQTPHARVVTVASRLARRPDPDDLAEEARAYTARDAQARSAGALRLLTWELDRRLEGERVYANVVHQGMREAECARVDPETGLLRRVSGPFFRLFGRSSRDGADTALWVATSPDCEMSRGNLYERRKIARCELRDERLEGRLWEACEALSHA
ncbi:MAG: SDR family NAD(P)-dependent oxidoreductase [Polyangiaceae bacterium]|nr:SDR family NAD(P)-dependent oxidoreductase [Polyangiaceae bacterium]